jgi:hypothetical protein
LAEIASSPAFMTETSIDMRGSTTVENFFERLSTDVEAPLSAS